jgi:hypothetical protein
MIRVKRHPSENDAAIKAVVVRGRANAFAPRDVIGVTADAILAPCRDSSRRGIVNRRISHAVRICRFDGRQGGVGRRRTSHRWRPMPWWQTTILPDVGGGYFTRRRRSACLSAHQPSPGAARQAGIVENVHASGADISAALAPTVHHQTPPQVTRPSALPRMGRSIFRVMSIWSPFFR